MTTVPLELSTISFEEEWEKFIASIPEATIFHHPTWLNTISQAYGYQPFGLILRDSNGEIRVALPVALVDSQLTGKRWIAYPFSDYCFPLYRSEQDLALFSLAIIQFCEEKQVDPLEIRWHLPQNHRFQIGAKAVLHLLKLDSDINKVYKGINPKHRNHIRQAERHAVHVEMGRSSNALQTFYRLHLETRRRQGVPIQPWKFFEQLKKNVLEGEHGFVSLAYHEGRCIAGAIFLFYNKTITYKYSASNRNLLHLRPNNLILWRAIQWGCENSYTLMDFGKTDRENLGLRDFKSNWGAEEQELIYSSISSQLIPTRTYHLNRLVEGIIRKSPLWVCRLSGELFYKHFA